MKKIKEEEDGDEEEEKEEEEEEEKEKEEEESYSRDGINHRHIPLKRLAAASGYMAYIDKRLYELAFTTLLFLLFFLATVFVATLIAFVQMIRGFILERDRQRSWSGAGGQE